jgi:hypothetical protein
MKAWNSGFPIEAFGNDGEKGAQSCGSTEHAIDECCDPKAVAAECLNRGPGGSMSTKFLVLFAMIWLAAFRPAWAAASAADLEWEKTVKAAEQEGQVNVYAISQEAEWHAFQRRFPKIKLVLVHGSASQTLQRIMAERRAGKFVADVVRLGSREIVGSARSGFGPARSQRRREVVRGNSLLQRSGESV